MKKLMLNEQAVAMNVSTEFVAHSRESWKNKKLTNFMPPFLSGVMNFEDGYSFYYQTSGNKETYPRKIEFYGKSSYGEISGLITVHPGHPYIKYGEVRCSSYHEKRLMYNFVKFALSVFGEYNYQKMTRNTELSSPKPRKTRVNQVKSGISKTRVRKDRVVRMDTKTVSKPFSESACEKASSTFGSNSIRGSKKNYVMETWACAGYYRKNGTYVEPCMKHRRKELL